MAKSKKSSKVKKIEKEAKAKESKKTSKALGAEAPKGSTLTDALRVPAGPVDMASLDARATPGYPGKGKDDAADLTVALAPALSDLQERLYADGKADTSQAKSILVVLQGMDTSGKGGVIRHAFGLVDPQGVHLKAFKAPTKEELSHHFLWRVKRELPARGMIGIFDRSHYEDVLIGRVNHLAPARTINSRYDQINRFEADLAAQGVTIIKCFLRVSKDEQLARLNERLDNPEKYWKYNPGDVDSRAKWDDYEAAYAIALERCNTEVAPWYVIPADRKWYRNWAVAQLLVEHLRKLDPQWPPADFDVAEQKKRLNELG